MKIVLDGKVFEYEKYFVARLNCNETDVISDGKTKDVDEAMEHLVDKLVVNFGININDIDWRLYKASSSRNVVTCFEIRIDNPFENMMSMFFNIHENLQDVRKSCFGKFRW